MYDRDSSSFSLTSDTSFGESDLFPIDTPQASGDFEFLGPSESSPHCETSSCGTESLTLSVCDHEVAHGRRYHGYKRGRYPLPNDDAEQQREDILHAMMLELTKGRLFYSDVGDYPQKIIDIGTGTGLWAIDVADSYPSASVVGTDLSPIQPSWLPVNARMLIEDCEESPWLHGSEYDLVHFRYMTGLVQDMEGLVAKAFPHIKEGGWIEFQEVLPPILCDDDTMKNTDPLLVFNELTMRGMRELGFNTAFNQDTLQAMLEGAGFVNVQCVVVKVPISAWSSDTDQRTVGLFMRALIEDALEAYAAKPLDALGIADDERESLTKMAKAAIRDDSVHRYMHCVFCYGQKESLMSDSDSYF